jgi:hypothetical protein
MATAAVPDLTERAADESAGDEMLFALGLSEGSASTPAAVCAAIAACAPALRTAVAGDEGAPAYIVAKGHARRGYDVVRVTRVSNAASPAPETDLFTYDEPFAYRWTQFRVATGLVGIDGAGRALADVGEGEPLAIDAPPAGAGAVGVWISDPCYTSSYVLCPLGAAFATGERTPALLNALLEGDARYWAMLGDNLYDRDGALTAAWWSRLSRAAQSRLFLTTAGNHDLWIDGNPGDAAKSDQFGYGFLQFYGQDSAAALVGDGPFDLSVDPDDAFASFPARVDDALPDVSNFVWYSLVGNVGYSGFAAVFALNETAPYLAEACDWALGEYDAGRLDLFVLAGHWNALGDGAASSMPTPHVHRLSASGEFGEGCAALARLDRLKFVEGHEHCNKPHGRGPGWTVAAQGMSGCGTYDLAVLDTTGGRAVLLNFRVADVDGLDNYEPILRCLRAKGAAACADFADVWLNQSLARPPSRGAP